MKAAGRVEIKPSDVTIARELVARMGYGTLCRPVRTKAKRRARTLVVMLRFYVEQERRALRV